MTSSYHSSSVTPHRSHPKLFTLGGGRYLCQRTLGYGTYGRVLQCLDQQHNRIVAVKIAHKDPAYTQAADVEYHTLRTLQERTIHTVKTFEKFEERGHVCIVMEHLAKNLFEVGRKRSESKGEMLHLDELRQIVHGVLIALTELHRMGMMHCDVKPENIMFRSLNKTQSPSSRGFLLPFSNSAGNNTAGNQSVQHGEQQSSGKNNHSPSPCSPVWACGNGSVSSPSANHPGENPLNSFSPAREASEDSSIHGDEKVLDFRNACLIDYGAVRRLQENTYFHIQSMWYRAPEVLCNVRYTPKIDSWSVGCLLFEMYTGHPLFAGSTPKDQLELITEVVGSFPHLRNWDSKMALGVTEHSNEKIADILRSKADAARRQIFRSKGKLGDGGGKKTISACGTTGSTISSSRDGSVAALGTQDAINVTPSSSRQSGPSLLGSGASTSSSENTTPNSITFLSELGWSPSPVTSEGDCGAFGDVERYAEASYIDLMARLLCPDETRRLSCEKALEHPFFTSFSSLTEMDSKSGSGIWWGGSSHQHPQHFPSSSHPGGCGDSGHCCSNSGTLTSISGGGLGGVFCCGAPSFSSRGGDGLSSSPSLLLSDYNSTYRTTNISFHTLSVPGGSGLISQSAQGGHMPSSTCSLQQSQQTVLTPTQFSQDVVGACSGYAPFPQGVNDPVPTTSGFHPITVSTTRANGKPSLSLSTSATCEGVGRSTTDGISSTVYTTDFPPVEVSPTFRSSAGVSSLVGGPPMSFIQGENGSGVAEPSCSAGGERRHSAFGPAGSVPIHENSSIGVLNHTANRELLSSHKGGGSFGSGSNSRALLSKPGASSAGDGMGTGKRGLGMAIEHQQKQQQHQHRLHTGLWNFASLHPCGHFSKCGYPEPSQSGSPLTSSSVLALSSKGEEPGFFSSNGNSASSHPFFQQR